MRFNLDAAEEQYAEVAKLFGVHDAAKSEEENALAAIDAVAKVGNSQSFSCALPFAYFTCQNTHMLQVFWIVTVLGSSLCVVLHCPVAGAFQLSIDVGTAKSIRQLGGSEGDIPKLVQQVLNISKLDTCVC